MVPKCFADALSGCETDNKTPTEGSVAEALSIMCCNKYDNMLCEKSILAGARSNKGSMNGILLDAVDINMDGTLDACGESNKYCCS